jgi:hypothetical protein
MCSLPRSEMAVFLFYSKRLRRRAGVQGVFNAAAFIFPPFISRHFILSLSKDALLCTPLS